MIPYNGVAATVATRDNEHSALALAVLTPPRIGEFREKTIVNLTERGGGCG